MVVAHFDDGKMKYQSHEVYVGYSNDDDSKVHCMEDHTGMPISGYGETKEEAFQDMQKKFNRYFSRLNALKITIDRESFKYVEVDCLGQKVDSK